jgi:hypothetical protein
VAPLRDALTSIKCRYWPWCWWPPPARCETQGAILLGGFILVNGGRMLRRAFYRAVGLKPAYRRGGHARLGPSTAPLDGRCNLRVQRLTPTCIDCRMRCLLHPGRGAYPACDIGAHPGCNTAWWRWECSNPYEPTAFTACCCYRIPILSIHNTGEVDSAKGYK